MTVQRCCPAAECQAKCHVSATPVCRICTALRPSSAAVQHGCKRTSPACAILNCAQGAGQWQTWLQGGQPCVRPPHCAQDLAVCLPLLCSCKPIYSLRYDGCLSFGLFVCSTCKSRGFWKRTPPIARGDLPTACSGINQCLSFCQPVCPKQQPKKQVGF
jgi:hypothetical protein